MTDAAPTERHVDVGGHRLRVRLVGGAGPTVVLEAGLAEGLDTWTGVQPDVGAFARSLSYDRAGLGASQPGPGPRSPDRLADELAALLTALSWSGPAVIVAHSAGAFPARELAARHPGMVAGLVLLDPAHEQQARRYRETDPAFFDAERARRDEVFRAGPPGVLAEWTALRAVVGRAETPCGPELPDVPTVILTAVRARPDATRVAARPAGVAARLALHAAWARGRSRMLHLPVEGGGHRLHVERPSLVVAAVREVCQAVVRGDAPQAAALEGPPGDGA